MIACKKCGNVNGDGITFCTRCGAFLEWSGEPAGEAPGSVSRKPTRDDSPRPQPIQSPRFDLVIADLEPDHLKVDAGGEIGGVIRVRNASSVVDAIAFEAKGQPAAWASIEPPSINLYPGTEGDARIMFRVPRGPGARAGAHPFAVAVRSQANPDSSVAISGVLDVQPFDASAVTVTPQRARGRRRIAFRVAVRNDGNHLARLRIEVIDPEGLLRFDVGPATLDVEPGAVVDTSVRVAASSWIWLGSPQNRPVQIRVFQLSPETGEADRLIAESAATFVQIPVFTRLALVPLVAIGALLLVAAVAGAGQCVPFLQQCPPDASPSPDGSPSASLAEESLEPSDEASASVTQTPTATVTDEPVVPFVVNEVCVGPTCDVIAELEPVLRPDYQDYLLVAIVFSNPVDPDTLVSGENLRLQGIGVIAEEVTGGLAYSGDRRTVLWTSSQTLAELSAELGGISSIHVTIVAEFVGLRDEFGNELDGDLDGSPGGDFEWFGPAT